MPSPIGHSLIGCATGIVLWAPPGTGRRLLRGAWQARWWLLGCVAAANAPDIDFVPGLLTGDLNAFHHGPTHSLLWAVLVAVGAGGVAGSLRPGRGRWVGGAAFLLVGGHLAADLVCQDFAAPYGIMLFWPLDPTYLLSPHSVFLAMDKASLAEVFSPANLGPAWRELWVGALCVGAAVATRLRRT